MGGSLCGRGASSANHLPPEALAAEYDEMCDGYDRQTRATQVTATELQEWLRDGKRVHIFDVRGGDEHSVSSLPGTILLPPTKAGMAAAMSGFGYLSFDGPVPAASSIDADTKVVCHCTAGLRSGFAAVALENEWKKQGVDRTVYNLHGGIVAWVNSGGSVVDPSTGGSQSVVHTYAEKWGRYVCADGVKAIWT